MVVVVVVVVEVVVVVVVLARIGQGVKLCGCYWWLKW